MHGIINVNDRKITISNRAFNKLEQVFFIIEKFNFSKEEKNKIKKQIFDSLFIDFKKGKKIDQNKILSYFFYALENHFLNLGIKKEKYQDYIYYIMCNIRLDIHNLYRDLGVWYISALNQKTKGKKIKEKTKKNLAFSILKLYFLK